MHLSYVTPERSDLSHPPPDLSIRLAHHCIRKMQASACYQTFVRGLPVWYYKCHRHIVSVVSCSLSTTHLVSLTQLTQSVQITWITQIEIGDLA